ncbi:alpha/beta fold hydrolase [Streptomyces sp. NBC_01262]|uniref:alpha/beta fold hydrolase n=1 Tax=Streptomyces sp. NBC_01262 TaxID=2903803 RepID=UPI002E31510D|nr:alpha/beta fold hydrolase [Streptomyces sp. NBC_01262]
MSRPPSLTLPQHARAYRMKTARGSFAVLDCPPCHGTDPLGTVLMVPGFIGSKEDFMPLLGPLSAAGYRGVAVDGRGQYESGGPADEGAYAQLELAADVVAQTVALGDGPVHLLGHSTGGLTARAAVLHTWPSAQPWASLTLMSSGPAAIEEGQQARIRLLGEVLPILGKEAVWREMQKLEERAEAPPEVAAFLHRRWVTTRDAQLLATGRQLIDEPDRVAELAAVPLPILVLSGTSDYAWPVPWQDDMARRLAARRVVIPGCDHSPSVEDPGATAQALVAFWRSVAAELEEVALAAP